MSAVVTDPSLLRLALAAYIRRNAGIGCQIIVLDSEIQELRGLKIVGRMLPARAGRGMVISLEPADDTVAVLRRRSK